MNATIDKFDPFDCYTKNDELIPDEIANSELFNKIIDAIKSNNLQYFHDFITNGNDINIKNSEGNNALHFAVEDNCHTMIEPLINLGIDINAQDNYGHTSLHDACYYNSYQSCVSLISAGANLNLQDNNGKTPLHFCIGIDIKFLKLLVASGADITIPDISSNSLFHTAIANHYGRYIKELQFLIDIGVNVNHQNANGDTPLMLAIEYGHIDVVTSLLKQSIDFSLINIDDENAFHIAAKKGCLNVFLAGMNYPNFNKDIMQLNKDNESVLNVAMYNNNTIIVDFINTYNEYHKLKNDTTYTIESNNLNKKLKL